MVEETDSAFLRRLHERIVEIKHDRETEERYMLFEEMLAKKKAEGIEEGTKLGEQQAKKLMLKLINEMISDGRAEELVKLGDQNFYDSMIEKYQIQNF